MENKFCLFHTSGKLIAEWRIEDLVDAFSTKMPNLILVVADCKLDSKRREKLWYNEVYYLEGIDKNKFIEFPRSSVITVDLRMHLKRNNVVRNHGATFRIEEKYLPERFYSKINLLEFDFEEATSMIEIEEKTKKIG